MQQILKLEITNISVTWSCPVRVARARATARGLLSFLDEHAGGPFVAHGLRIIVSCTEACFFGMSVGARSVAGVDDCGGPNPTVVPRSARAWTQRPDPTSGPNVRTRCVARRRVHRHSKPRGARLGPIRREEPSAFTAVTAGEGVSWTGPVRSA